MGATFAVAVWFFRARLPARLRPKGAQYLILLWAGAFLSAAVVDCTVNMPKAEAAAIQIRQELAEIPQPAGAARLSETHSYKTSSALAQALFAGTTSWSDLRRHFDSALAAGGWSFVREYGYTDGGRDYGGRIACYVKRNERVNVDMPGQDPNVTYDFSVAILWEFATPSC
jgi:hypothetical protein